MYRDLKKDAQKTFGVENYTFIINDDTSAFVFFGGVIKPHYMAKYSVDSFSEACVCSPPNKAPYHLVDRHTIGISFAPEGLKWYCTPPGKLSWVYAAVHVFIKSNNFMSPIKIKILPDAFIITADHWKHKTPIKYYMAKNKLVTMVDSWGAVKLSLNFAHGCFVPLGIPWHEMLTPFDESGGIDIVVHVTKKSIIDRFIGWVSHGSYSRRDSRTNIVAKEIIKMFAMFAMFAKLTRSTRSTRESDDRLSDILMICRH